MQPLLHSHHRTFSRSLFREHRVIFVEPTAQEGPQSIIEASKGELSKKTAVEDIKSHIEQTLNKIETSGNTFVSKKFAKEKVAMGSILNSEKVRPAIDAFQNYKIEAQTNATDAQNKHVESLKKLGHTVLDELTKVLTEPQSVPENKTNENPEAITQKKEEVKKILGEKVLSPVINELYEMDNTGRKQILTNSQILLDITLGQLDAKTLQEKTPQEIIALAIPALEQQTKQLDLTRQLVDKIVSNNLTNFNPDTLFNNDQNAKDHFFNAYAAELADRSTVTLNTEKKEFEIIGTSNEKIITDLKAKLGIDEKNPNGTKNAADKSLVLLGEHLKQAQGSKMMLEKIQELTKSVEKKETPPEEGLMTKVVKFIQAIMAMMNGENLEWGMGMLSGKSAEEMKESDQKALDAIFKNTDNSPDKLKAIIKNPGTEMAKILDKGTMFYQGDKKIQSVASEKLGVIYAKKLSNFEYNTLNMKKPEEINKIKEYVSLLMSNNPNEPINIAGENTITMDNGDIVVLLANNTKQVLKNNKWNKVEKE